MDLMIQAFFDGLYVLSDCYSLVGMVLVISIIPYGLLVISLLNRILGISDPTCLLAGGLSAGILFDALVSFFVLWIFPENWVHGVLIATVVCVWLMGFFLLIQRPIKSKLSPAIFLFLFIFLLLAILKLGFIQNLRLPLYTDSIEHYTIIQDLTRSGSEPHSFYNLQTFPSNYYHFGYHSLLAKIAILVQQDLAGIMLVVGQLILVCSACGMYFWVYRMTKSHGAGLLAMILTGVIGIMPGYAVNWGKYPAMTAIGLLPFVLGLIPFEGVHFFRDRKPGFWALFLIAAIAGALIHTRILFLYLILFSVMALFNIWNPKKEILIGIGLALTICLAFMILVKSAPFINIFDLYLRNDARYLVVAFLCAVVGILLNPRMTVKIVMMVWVMILFSIIRLPGFLQQYSAPIDLPFLKISLFIPLTLLVVLGIDRVLGLVKNNMQTTRWKVLVQAAFCVVILGLMFQPQYLFPSDCCSLSGKGDQYLYTWIERNTKHLDRILIAAEETSYQLAETDGGAWVEALSGRSIEKYNYLADFSLPEVRDEICMKNITYVYVGDSPFSFNSLQLDQLTDHFEKIIEVKGVCLYEFEDGWCLE